MKVIINIPSLQHRTRRPWLHSWAVSRFSLFIVNRHSQNWRAEQKRRRGKTWLQSHCRTYFETPPCGGNKMLWMERKTKTKRSWTWTQAHQWRRRAWRNADSPSITRRMDTVRTANRPNTGTRNKTPRAVSMRSPTLITMVQRTSDSSVKAEETKRKKKLDDGSG